MDRRLKITLLVMVVLLVISGLVYIYLVSQEGKREVEKKESPPTPTPRILSAKEAYTFNSLDEITFIPRRIDNYQFSDRIRQEAEEKYSNFTSADLKDLIIKKILTWAAFRDFYSDKNIEEFKLTQIASDITFNQIEQELPLMEDYYIKNTLTVSGFYLKTRFEGIFPDSLKKLNKSKIELRNYAENLLKQYIEKAQLLSDPSQIVVEFNNNSELRLLNNQEDSLSLKEYKLYPPLFDDPEFFTMIKTSPVGKFSPIFLLKTKNPGQDYFQEYAFVSFYLTQKSGKFLPLNELINQFIKKHIIR